VAYWYSSRSVCNDCVFYKSRDLIKMPFGLLGWVGQRNDVLDGGPDHPLGRVNLGKLGWHDVTYR